jgi:hypothetical protein
MRAYEGCGLGQGGLAFIEDRCEALEHVGYVWCHVQCHGDVGSCGACCESGGVVEEDLV